MNVLIVDDHQVVRAGIQRLLHFALPGFEFFEAANSLQALRVLSETKIDVAILDLRLPEDDGFALLAYMIHKGRAPIVVFSMYGDVAHVRRALRMGTRGYVCKCAPADELVTAVKTLAGGGRYIDRQTAEGLALSTAADRTQCLTERELEILRLLAEGKSLREIGDVIGRSHKTVSNACGVIKSKLGLRSLTELVRLSVADFRQNERNSKQAG